MPLYRDVGVVLRTHKLGETDRIVTFITQESGKVRAVAKGVRKPGSRFGSRLEPMSHVQLQLYRGRDLDIVNQVELVETANRTRGCLESTTEGLAMCEVVEQLSHDREPTPDLYRMLVGALRQLNTKYSALVLPALQLRLLALRVSDHAWTNAWCAESPTSSAVSTLPRAARSARPIVVPEPRAQKPSAS